MTIAAGADAVIFPLRDNFLEAMIEALENRPTRCCLYTNGERVAWLPREIPGWFRVGAAVIKEPMPCAA
jgi:hypothetical protein